MKPGIEIRARLAAAHAAYSALLAEAERDEENQTPAEHEDYRYRLHPLNRERETLEWVLDLNKHGQPTGEHLGLLIAARGQTYYKDMLYVLYQ